MKVLSNNLAVLENDSHISRWVEESGRLDHDQYALSYILKYIKEGDCIVDAGAFIGDHTLAYLKAVGPRGKVIAFEPHLDAYQCLLHNCPEAECVLAGLGDKEEKLPFATNENVGASYISCSGDKQINIVTLDSYNLEHLDFLKLDVEGFELSALRGAKKTIDRFRPTMWIEVYDGALNRNHETAASLLSFVQSELRYEITPFPEFNSSLYDILCKPL